MRSVLVSVLALLLAAGAAAGGLIWSGTYNVGADEPHSRAVYRLLEIGRERSVAVRIAAIEVPDLTDAELLRRGAGNYAAMCEGCHLRPGLADTEIRRGLYPQPSALPNRDAGDAARDFWIIKHGLKSTGMPAWGLSMDDGTIWGMVAFLRSLPGQSPSAYQSAVAASSGHSHGGADVEMAEHEQGEDGDHKHAGGADHDHDAANAPGDEDDHRH